jgi:hypothetical protein
VEWPAKCQLACHATHTSMNARARHAIDHSYEVLIAIYSLSRDP